MQPSQEWIEVELTADSGACYTVIPRKTAEGIPILPSLASLMGMEYEVANGQSVPQPCGATVPSMNRRSDRS